LFHLRSGPIHPIFGIKVIREYLKSEQVLRKRTLSARPAE
jgi:hypothetical protein